MRTKTITSQKTMRPMTWAVSPGAVVAAGSLLRAGARRRSKPVRRRAAVTPACSRRAITHPTTRISSAPRTPPGIWFCTEIHSVSASVVVGMIVLLSTAQSAYRFELL